MTRLFSVSTVLVLLGVTTSRVAFADEFAASSATALGLAGAQVGAREDSAAVLANPAALGEGRLFVGALGHFALAPRSDVQPGLRFAYARGISEKLRVGFGVTPRAPLGCLVGCGTKTLGEATMVNYEATLALSYLAFDEPEGERLALSLGYRPHFTLSEGRVPSPSGVGFRDYSSASFGLYGLVVGAIYSPFEELSFGLVVESGSERIPFESAGMRFVGALAPRATLGAELDVDRLLVRLDYGVVGSSLVPELVFGEGASRRVVGVTETIVHEIRLGGAERFPVGRNELALRGGLSFRSNPGGSDGFSSSYLPVAAPIGGVSLGTSLRTRESEWSLGAGYRMNLGTPNGGVPATFSEFTVALDVSFELSTR